MVVKRAPVQSGQTDFKETTYQSRYLNKFTWFLELFFHKPIVFFFAYRWILIAENEALHSNDEISPINQLILKLYGLKLQISQLLSCHLRNFWKAVSHAIRAINRRNERFYLSIVWKFIQQACSQFLHLQLWRKPTYFEDPNKDNLFMSSEQKRSVPAYVHHRLC